MNPKLQAPLIAALAAALLTGGRAASDTPGSPPPAVLPGVNADPHLAVFGGTYYLYPTTDGTEGWRSTSFRAWSSRDLVQWRDEGVILDLPRDLKWADIHAWAPAIATNNGRFHLTWSEFDTRDPRYSVAYAVGKSPLGPFTKTPDNPILQQRGVVKGAGHHSIVQVPGRDEWVIAYHRFRIPDGNGYNRETCLSPLRHAADGRILPVDVFEPARLNPTSP